MNNESKVVEETTEDVNNQEVIDNEPVGEFTDTSTDDAQDDETNSDKQQPKMYTEEEANELAERISKQREARAYKKAEREKNRELQDYNELYDTLKAGMGVDNIEEMKSSLKNFYNEQGIKISEPKGLTEKQEKILAEADAKEIIELGDEEINRVANEIYNKPIEKRTIGEKVIFERLGTHIMEQKAKQSLIDKGIDTSILSDSKFKEFASKFNSTTPLSDIYEMFNNLNSISEKEIERPKSTGSAKSVATTNEIKEFYTPEEVSKFTMKDLDNPQLMKAVEDSMTKWK